MLNIDGITVTKCRCCGMPMNKVERRNNSYFYRWDKKYCSKECAYFMRRFNKPINQVDEEYLMARISVDKLKRRPRKVV